MSQTDLEQQFDEAMLNIYRVAQSDCGYTPSYFLQMLHERGSLSTAHYLILRPQPSDGYTKLYLLGRLDLTVEALVIKQPWRQLFSDDVLLAAEKRLEEYRYSF